VTFKNRLQHKLRGWLPQEPTLIVHHKQPEHKIPYMVPWFAMAILVGAAAATGLVLLGDFFGFTVGYGAYFWYAAVAAGAWVCAAFVAIYGYIKKHPPEAEKGEQEKVAE
jgi:hypothetical protein